MSAFSRATVRVVFAVGPAVGLAVGCNEFTGADGYDVVEIFDSGGLLDVGTSVPDTGPSGVHDAGVDAPRDAAPPAKLVFITSATFKGDLGGRLGADLKCKEAAASGGLTPTIWIAWVSITGHPAIERFTHTGSYRLPSGDEVVSTPSLLTMGTLAHPINVTEENIELTSNRGVWTGTKGDGSVDATCGDWTVGTKSSTGTLASSLATDEAWTKGASDPNAPNNWFCDTAVSLYCFEQ